MIFQFLNNSNFFLCYPSSSFSPFCSLQYQHPPWSANTLMILQQLDSSLNHSLPTLSSSCPCNTPFKTSARLTFSKNQIWSFHFLTCDIFLRASKAFHKLYITFGFISCQPPWVAFNTANAFTILRGSRCARASECAGAGSSAENALLCLSANHSSALKRGKVTDLNLHVSTLILKIQCTPGAPGLLV